VALAVGLVLRRQGVRAVLTGGACVSVYTDGTYVSRDVDFVLLSTPSQAQIDAALSSLGFKRNGDRYVHEEVPFYVEFLPGPLAVGGDFNIRPIEPTVREDTILALSPTDLCKDRLAAFHHWTDHQSLVQAVAIARHQTVNVNELRRWSRLEGKGAQFEEFLASLRSEP
jgi:hypothetical protein